MKLNNGLLQAEFSCIPHPSYMEVNVSLFRLPSGCELRRQIGTASLFILNGLSVPTAMDVAESVSVTFSEVFKNAKALVRVEQYQSLAYLDSLKVEALYRNKGIGTYFLKEIQKFIFNSMNTELLLTDARSALNDPDTNIKIQAMFMREEFNSFSGSNMYKDKHMYEPKIKAPELEYGLNTAEHIELITDFKTNFAYYDNLIDTDNPTHIEVKATLSLQDTYTGETITVGESSVICLKEYLDDNYGHVMDSLGEVEVDLFSKASSHYPYEDYFMAKLAFVRSFTINEKFQEKGLGTHFIKKIEEYLFKVMGIQAIFLQASPLECESEFEKDYKISRLVRFYERVGFQSFIENYMVKTILTYNQDLAINWGYEYLIDTMLTPDKREEMIEEVING